jgi:amino acid adenylation domain-containing protein
MTNDLGPSAPIASCTHKVTSGRCRVPASWAQKRLWFINRLEGAGTAYHLGIWLRLWGELRLEALQRALVDVVRRHEILRTTFSTQDGQIVQEISSDVEFDLKIEDLCLLDSRSRELRARLLEREEVMRPFDLEVGPLIRGCLIRLSDDEHILLLTMHHIISDGWSLKIIQRDLSELYRSYHDGEPAALPPLSLRYADYVHWEHEWLRGDRLDRQLGYWRERLAGAPPWLQLPTDRPRPATQSFRGAYTSFRIDDALTERLKNFARLRGMSLFMALLGSWAILLSKLSDEKDLVIGTPVANRPYSGVENLVGFFVNMLPLRLRVRDESTVEEFFDQLCERALEDYEHQALPFEKIVEVVHPKRDLSRHPLFQVVLAFQNVPPSQVTLPGIKVSAEDLEDEIAKFDLLLSLEETGGAIEGKLNYATDIFDGETVVRWIGGFKTLLSEVVAENSDLRIGDLEILSGPERRELLEGFNPAPQYRQDRLIHELFEQRVRLHPQAIAVTCEEESLTYFELNARANKLAWHLQEKGVGPDQLVGICVERSLQMVVGLLGILKAGGAYVPFDPNFPAERLAYMLEDAAPAVLVTQERLIGRLPAHARMVTLDSAWSDIGRHPSSNLPAAEIGLRPDHLAYVIYTSGSTGKPKGAMNEHRAVVNRLLWMQEEYALTERDRVLQKTPFSFDVSVWEFFWPLMTGARLVVARPGGHQDPGYLTCLIEKAGITTLHFVPSMLQAFVQQHQKGRCPSIRHVICSGEELSPVLQNRCLEQLPQACLSNLYGPTECAVDVTAWECTRDEVAARVPIGRPIANTRIYVLDRRGRPVPIGVAGEVYIAGIQVGRGYLNRPELTRERFVPDPFSSEANQRMYKTGDIGRWRADGAIEYLGRNDGQVKIRGFRIELGEIEAQLVRHREVKEAVVLAREDEPGDKRLVGYVIPRESGAAPSTESLREHLKTALPEYMVPNAFVMLEAFPLSPNGKLDRRGLPAPDLSAYTSRDYEAPRGKIEEGLAGIWRDLLHLERVGRHDNFFELGGHSLLGIQLLAKVKADLGVALPVSAVFRYPVLMEMAGAAALLRQAASEAVVIFSEPEYEEGVIALPESGGHRPRCLI